jgi:lipopolysaccharide/colanic/teichoic acid biosynthesis glycosyltransferase
MTEALSGAAETPGTWPPPAPAAYLAAKRVLDAAIAALVLGLGSPLWLALAAAIRLTSPGPAIFRRHVAGEGGRVFTYYKFRTMRAGDDRHHREWLQRFVVEDRPYAEDQGRPVYKAIDDVRVTPVGRLLRRFSLDEVPQLINVLRGDMSIVGPRPPILAEYELYDERARRRLAVKPGLTGLYQVTARSQVPFSRMAALDCEYIARRSLGLDLAIMARTFGVMLRGSGAA